MRHHSRLLIKREEWDSLRQLALSMRTPFDASAKQILLDQSLIDFSYFLQGRAEFAVNRKRSAKDSFDEISERLSKSEMLNEVDLSIDNMGFHEKASELLIAGESVHKQEPHYWLVRFNNAYALKEAEQILVAALAAYQLDESNPVHQNNYAAALLIHRAKPEEALTLTKSLLTAYPYSFQAQINHALALAQNKQPEAALKIIRQIPRERLISMENSFVNLALFDSHLLRSETAQAKETAEAINPDHLLPLQQEWLESQLEQLISSK